jgi:hypothetical protein
MSVPNSIQYSISPSISAVAKVFGDHTNNYKLFRAETKQPPQTLLSYLSSDFAGCYLRVSMTDPIALAQIHDKKRTLHIPVDSKHDFWLGFKRCQPSTATTDLKSGFEIKLPISVLGYHFITLIENIQENQSQTQKLNAYFAEPTHDVSDIVLDIPVSSLPDCYKPHVLRVAKFPSEDSADVTNPMPKPHMLMPTTWTELPEECRCAVKYELVINLKKQNLKHQIQQIECQPAHTLYPAMNEKHKRRARLLDCRCLKFGCSFVCDTPEELKHHLKTSPCSDYVDFYAANHQRLATDSLQIIDDQLFKNSFPALCRKTIRTIQGVKGQEPHKTYTCNSPLCEYSTHTIENILEHFRLLGCQYSPIIQKYYGTGHTLPTEADNRKWLVDNLVDELNGDLKMTGAAVVPLTVSGNTKINLEKSSELYRFDIVPFNTDKFIEWYSTLIANLSMGGMCIMCCANRQNVVSLSCCHLSVCSRCLGSFQSPKCAECFLPLDEYLVITGI